MKVSGPSDPMATDVGFSAVVGIWALRELRMEPMVVIYMIDADKGGMAREAV